MLGWERLDVHVYGDTLRLEGNAVRVSGAGGGSVRNVP